MYIKDWLVVLGAFLLLLGTPRLVTKIMTYNVVSSVHVPAFSVNDCFVRTALREPWEQQADGKIMLRGTLRYLVMDAAEANRVSGGDKFSYDVDIELFDQTHRKVLCPTNWMTHMHQKS